MSSNLVSHFASAGLDLRLADGPLARGVTSTTIFQLDIRRERAHDVRSEHFLAWLGARGNAATVQGKDKRERQLILAVREGADEFEESIPHRFLFALPGAAGSMVWKKALAARIGSGVRADQVVARTGGASLVRVTQRTTRHMLVGRDERQLFICQLPRPCTSVKEAHDALRTPAAKTRSRSKLDQPIRQGEWFFVIPAANEIDELEKAIRGNRTVIRKKTSINSIIPRMGKPHIADEIAVHFTTTATTASAPREMNVFVRGAVRHPDHKTIQIHHWRRVLRNLEVDQDRSPLGGTWMD